MRKLPSCGIVVLLLLFNTPYTVRGAIGASDIDSVFTQARFALNTLNSIQFDSRCDYELSEDAASRHRAFKTTFTSHCRFYEQNGKYRSEALYENWQEQEKEKIHWLSLYNGEQYQLYDTQVGLLTHSKKARMPNTSITPNPLLMPYLFLLSDDEDSTLSLDSLRNQKTWDKAARDALWLGVERIGDHDCAVIDIPDARSARQVFHRVYFAQDMGCLPIRVEVRVDGDKMIGMLDVDNTETHRSESGDISIATSVQIIDYDQSGEILMKTHMAVDADTLRINEPVNEAIFEMSPSEARALFDCESDLLLVINPSVVPLSDMMQAGDSQVERTGGSSQPGIVGAGREKPPSFSEEQTESGNRILSLSPDVQGRRHGIKRLWTIPIIGLIFLSIVVIFFGRWRRALRRP